MTLGPMNLTKVLYFDQPESEYSSALANEWSDYDALMTNIRMGCKRKVEELIDFGCRINKPGRYGTPLSMVVKNGWTNVAKKMLDKGTRVSDAGWIADSPLYSAFFKKKLTDGTSLINAMLERYLIGKKEDFVHADGLGFFHIACARGDLKYVKEFLQGGAVNINRLVSTSAKEYAGYSALHFAVAFKRNDVLELLLKHGADIYVQDVNGSTALHLAFYQQNWYAVERLLNADREKKDVANNSGLTHFMIACTSSDSWQAEHYLWKMRRSLGASGPSILISKQVNAPTMKKVHPYASYTPLHFAAMCGRMDTVKLLLSHHANCCATNSDWHKPSALARKNGHLEVCRYLRKHCLMARVELVEVKDKFDDYSVPINEDSGYDSNSFSNTSAH